MNDLEEKKTTINKSSAIFQGNFDKQLHKINSLI